MADTNTLLAQGIANLSKLFAPPSGSEHYAWQRAGALRDEQARLRTGRAEILRIYGPEAAAVFDAGGAQGLALHPKLDLYRASTQPGATPRSLDPRLAAVHGSGGTFEGIDTKERGETARNAARIAGEDRRHFGKTILSKDQVAHIAPGPAKQYGVPQTISGVLEFDQGKTYRVPGSMPGEFSTVSGPPKPLTMTEWQAAQAANLPPADQRSITMQGVPVEKVVGSDGKAALVPRDRAVGMEPAPTGGPQLQSGYAILSDGRRVPAVYNPATGRTSTPDGQVLPPDAQFSKVVTQTSSPDALGPSVRNNADMRLMDMSLVEAGVNQLYSLAKANPGVFGAPGAIRGLLQNALATGGDVAKMFEESKNRFLQDVARGAVAPDIVTQLAPNGQFDPAIPQADLLMHMLTTQVAKMLDPDGRVSVYGLQRAREALGTGGTLANSQDFMARLEALRGQIATQREVLGKARPATAGMFPPTAGGAPAPAGPPAPSAAPQPGAAPPPVAPSAGPPPPPGFRVVQ